jgi:hypothetical protein
MLGEKDIARQAKAKIAIEIRMCGAAMVLVRGGGTAGAWLGWFL